MARRKSETCCTPAPDAAGGYQVEAVVTIDERGQMVLPKETRAKAGIAAGDKLAVVTWRGAGRVCCISLIKVEELAEMVKGLLLPEGPGEPGKTVVVRDTVTR